MIFALLLALFSINTIEAQEFLRRNPRIKIGSVLNTKGSVVALAAFDRSLLYLKRGDFILDRQSIVTRSDSQVTLKIGVRSILKLAANTKVTFIYLPSENRYLTRLIRGVVRYSYQGAGTPELFISGKSYGTYYSSIDFDAVLRKNRFYFKPEDKSKIIKYQRKGSQRNTLRVTQKDIEFLAQSENDDKPVYFIKNKTKPKKNKKTEAPQVAVAGSSASVAEAAAIFGDSISDVSAVSESTDVSDIFGDNTSQNQAADIFGEAVDTKSVKEKLKLKDNIGVKLEKKRKRPLNQIGVIPGRSEPNAFEALDLSLFLKSTLYANEPSRTAGNVDDQGFHQDIRLNFGNKVKINDVESLTFSGWLDTSNRKEVYNELGETLDLQSSQRNNIYLNEFYYTYTTRKFDIQFGKKVIRTGKGIIYNPSDSFAPVDASVPTSPLFLGSFVVSVDYYLKDWTLTGMLFPAIVPNKSPTQNSRWTTLYSDINFELEQEFPSGFSPKTKQVFLKLEGTKWGTDWQFSFFNGPNNNPVVRNDIVVNNNVPTFTLVQEHVPITFMAAGFSTTFGGLELHGEILNQNAEDGKDDSFTAMMLGFRYVMDTFPKAFGLNSIDLVVEHGRENLRSAQSQPFYALSSIGSRFYQNSWVGTTIFNVTDDFSFNYDFHFDLENEGTAQIFGMNYNAGASQWRLKMELYDGEDTSNFGQWRDNDNTSLEYVYNW